MGRSLTCPKVSAILETHSLWESSARVRAVNVLQQLPQLVSPDENLLPVFSESELREGQLSDPVLSRVLYFVEVLKGIHDSAGHQGQFRSLSLARQRFFWPHIDGDVKDYVRRCQRCVISKTADPEGRAPLESIKTSAPLEIVCIDFWTAEDSTNKSIDVLVVTDHFTRLAQAFPCRDQSAKQVAKQL